MDSNEQQAADVPRGVCCSEDDSDGCSVRGGANDCKFTKSPGESSGGKLSMFYESRRKKKIVRLMTVTAYVFSVSLAALLLSLYYVFLWDPRLQKHIKTGSISDRIETPVSDVSTSNFYNYTDIQKIKNNSAKMPFKRAVRKVSKNKRINM
ncbi:Uncharacterised protein at_DN1120 [Pycnogonum litorale]